MSEEEEKIERANLSACAQRMADEINDRFINDLCSVFPCDACLFKEKISTFLECQDTKAVPIEAMKALVTDWTKALRDLGYKEYYAPQIPLQVTNEFISASVDGPCPVASRVQPILLIEKDESEVKWNDSSYRAKYCGLK
jgi:hypothetical protein